MQMFVHSPRSQGFVLLLLLLLAGRWAGAQVLTNGSFDNINAGCSNNVVNRNNPFADGCVPGWQSSHGTPDINGTPSDYYTFMYGGLYNGSVGSEGIFTLYSFQNNVQYDFTFWARNIGAQAGTPTLIINIADGLQESGNQNFNPQGPPTAGITRREVGRQNVTGAWAQYTVTFTAPAAASQFWLYPDANINVGNGGSPHQIEINGLTLASTCVSGDVYYQNTATLPAMTKNQGRIFAGQQVTGGISGPVSVGNGQTVAFRSLGEIALLDGFSVDPGAQFSAVMVPCRGVNYRDANGPEASTNNKTTESAAYPPPQAPCDCLRDASFAASASPSQSAASRTAPPSPADEAVQVYPNPAHDHLMVVLPNVQRFSATGEAMDDTAVDHRSVTGLVYNLYGHEVQRLTLQSGTTTVSVKELKPGIYYLHVPLTTQTIKTTFVVAP